MGCSVHFRIADSFTDGLARLTGDEQKAAKTTALDLQLNPFNPVNPGMQLHNIEESKDRNFWSVRVGSDIRLIVHKTSGSMLLCYVDHHDKAYDWAKRRKLECVERQPGPCCRHPATDAVWMWWRRRLKGRSGGRSVRTNGCLTR